MEIKLVDALAAEVVNQELSASDSPVARHWPTAKISRGLNKMQKHASHCRSNDIRP